MVACTSPARLLASSTTPHTSIPDYFHACDLRLSPRELFSSIDFILYEGFPPLFAFLERAGYDSD
jgi:hypothetical protein